MTVGLGNRGWYWGPGKANLVSAAHHTTAAAAVVSTYHQGDFYSSMMQNLKPYANWIAYRGKDFFVYIIKKYPKDQEYDYCNIKLEKKVKKTIVPPDPTNCAGFCTIWENCRFLLCCCALYFLSNAVFGTYRLYSIQSCQRDVSGERKPCSEPKYNSMSWGCH